MARGEDGRVVQPYWRAHQPHATSGVTREQVEHLLQEQYERIVRVVRAESRKLMATLTEVQDLVTLTGADAQAAADRVLAAIAAVTGNAAAQIADLQAQVEALIAGNAADITPEQLQSLVDGLTGVDTTIKGIAPAVVEPPTEG